tara:strand:+ start:3548 stop:3754 length:207 start_codon:yes stop_codon:yes gene_type:complete
MTSKEIIKRIKNIRDAFANGDINSDGIIEHIDDLVLDVRDRSDGFSEFEDDGDYYKSFEETDFTKLDV